jgi:predicted hydrolase (HD superfamily)
MWNEIAIKELDENTNKSTKFCFNKRTKWKYEQKHKILVESLAGLRALAREYDVDIEKYPILSC